MGIEPGFLILEVGYDNDAAEDLRSAIQARTGTELLDYDSSEVVDAVIIWWREGDGDLVDELVDGLTFLAEAGSIWLLTPKLGRPNHVEPSDIQDAAPTAGLSQTSSFAASADWTATRLIARKSGRK
ncbi:MAG: DUF3052 domain-containing protein [Actinomycetes bacterium]|jgi:hypothetical protein